MSKHSPLPWTKVHEFNIVDANGRSVANFGAYQNNVDDPEELHQQKIANTNLTTTAVNAQPAIMALLGTVSRVFPNTYQGKTAKALLRQLGGSDD